MVEYVRCGRKTETLLGIREKYVELRKRSVRKKMKSAKWSETVRESIRDKSRVKSNGDTTIKYI